MHPATQRKNSLNLQGGALDIATVLRALPSIAVLLLLLALASSCSNIKGARPNVDLGEESNGKEISLHVGEMFTVRLPENPTTGYTWRLDKDGSPVCSKVGDSFSPPADSRMGSPGTHEWRFRAEKPGAATIEMRLSRKWNGDSATRSFVLRLLVPSS
jgi:inhibitor of cysteine peptidase